MDDQSEGGKRNRSNCSAAPAHEPPRVYHLACGARCDVFWWARRTAPKVGEPIAPNTASQPDD